MAVWHDIPGWEGLYQVTRDGAVKSLGRTLVILTKKGFAQPYVYLEKVLKPYICNGYPRHSLTTKDGKKQKFYAHHLVCITFHGPRPDGHEVAHNDGDRLNPSADNLRWATRKENLADTWLHGTHRCGEMINGSKLTEADVRAIRLDSRSQEQIRKDYGLSVGYVGQLKRRETWAHLGEAA